jgi:hypothetical protein
LAGFCFQLTSNCVVSRNLFVPLLLVLGSIYRQNKVKVEGWVGAELLAQEQMQLAKLHELRVAVEAGAQLQSEHEREELGCKVQLRMLQADTKRLALLEAEKQRHAAVHERIAQSAMQCSHQE